MRERLCWLVREIGESYFPDYEFYENESDARDRAGIKSSRANRQDGWDYGEQRYEVLPMYRTGTGDLELSESNRQLVLMALAHLAVERPGFEPALEQIAMRIDNVIVNPQKPYMRLPEMYTRYRRIKKGQQPLPTSKEVIRRIR